MLYLLSKEAGICSKIIGSNKRYTRYRLLSSYFIAGFC
jgi:hypothetical protein